MEGTLDGTLPETDAQECQQCRTGSGRRGCNEPGLNVTTDRWMGLPCHDPRAPMGTALDLLRILRCGHRRLLLRRSPRAAGAAGAHDGAHRNDPGGRGAGDAAVLRVRSLAGRRALGAESVSTRLDLEAGPDPERRRPRRRRPLFMARSVGAPARLADVRALEPRGARRDVGAAAAELDVLARTDRHHHSARVLLRLLRRQYDP